MHDDIQPPTTLRILLANVRGLSSKKKQEEFNRKIIMENANNFNALMLTETHLTKPFSAPGWHVTQTRMDRKGGTLVATNLPRCKAIKTLSTGVAWASVLVKTQTVHLLSV